MLFPGIQTISMELANSSVHFVLNLRAQCQEAYSSDLVLEEMCCIWLADPVCSILNCSLDHSIWGEKLKVHFILTPKDFVILNKVC